jgi:succinate-semialdehyde dehydrogenase/glutarate-semialdehyde dehydrogenase
LRTGDIGSWRLRTAWRSWRTAQLHRERIDELSELLTLEVGKSITQARGEVDLVAAIYPYYADHAARFLTDETLDIVGGGEAIVRTEPFG